MKDDLLNLALTARDFGITLVIFGLIFYFIEKIRPAEKNTPFFKKDFKIELGLATLNQLVFNPLATTALAFTLIVLLKDALPYQIFDATITRWPLPLQILAGTLIMDFSTYWRHRLAHAFLWPYHSIHHSVTQITWLSGLRLHPLEVFIATAFDMIFLHVMGFSGEGIFLATTLMLAYNFFAHANISLKYPSPVRYIFVSPHLHRWHHANEKSAYDKNFSSVFSILDVIFGTYHHPEHLPQSYGLSDAQAGEYPRPLVQQLLYPVRKNCEWIKKRLQRKL